MYNKEACDVKHNSLAADIKAANSKLDAIDTRVSNIEQISASRGTEVANICEAVDKLTVKIDKILEQNNRMLLTIVTMLAGFFVFIIEQVITKAMRGDFGIIIEVIRQLC